MDYYAILGVPRYSDISTVRAAYMAQIRIFHPDVFVGNPEIARIKTTQLNEAYGVLKNEETKEAYDRYLAAAERQDQQHGYSNTTQNDTHTPHKNNASRNILKALLHFVLQLAAPFVLLFAVCGGILLFDSVSADAPVTDELKSPSLRPVSTPENGHIFYFTSVKDAVAPLSVITSGSSSYYVKLNNVISGETELTFFIRGGCEVEIDVPLGTYEILYASGEVWYGKAYLFGPDTVYCKADGLFEFYEDGQYVNGWTVELYPQQNGNLDIDTISADEF